MIIEPASTSVIRHVFLQDSTSTAGSGKTALIHSDITAYYVIAGGALVSLTMETITTLGTWAVSGSNKLGFKLVHDTNVPGLYEIHLPDNILATAGSVTIYLKASGVAPTAIRIDLPTDELLKATAELSADPGTTATLQKMIQLLYQSVRFKVEQTGSGSSGERKLYKADGSTVLLTGATSDNGSTFIQDALA